jgi:hypothetical protein
LLNDNNCTGKKTWKSLVQLDHCHDDLINSVTISPDGEYLVSVSQDDTLKTWRCNEVLTQSNTTPQSREYFVNNYDNRKWLSSIRPVFDPKHPHAFAVGSMESDRCFNFFMMSGGGGVDEGSHVKSVINYCDEVCKSSTCYIYIMLYVLLYATLSPLLSLVSVLIAACFYLLCLYFVCCGWVVYVWVDIVCMCCYQ